MGPLDLQNYFFEHRKQIADAIVNTKEVIVKVSEEFEKISGRRYDLFEKYELDDAEVAIVVLNSTAGTAKTVVDKLRAEGVKAGLLKPRAFIPFPHKEVADAIKHVKALAVMDKADSLNGMCGQMYMAVASAMLKNGVNIPVSNYIYGLGGRDVKAEDIELVYNNLLYGIKSRKGLTDTMYLGVRE